MNKYLLVMAILFSFELRAQAAQKSLAGFDPRTDIISENYEAGAFLMYDCSEKHWVCVTESYFLECKNKINTDKDDHKLHYSCAPIGEFPTKKACFQRQLFLTTHDHGHRFCVKDKWKDKAVD